MNESGQTDADRRKLRNSLRGMEDKILNSAVQMENPNEKVFQQICKENNALFNEVAYTREAILDADNFELTASFGARQVARLVQVRNICCLNR